MNSYEQKQADRKAYFEGRAADAADESAGSFERARDMGSAIPMGQPILVGHHSEKCDRAFRGRIDNTFRQGVDQQKKADYYAQKAASVGKGGISGDDPDAIAKLKAKLDRMEADQTLMKAANRVVRAKKKSEQEKLAGLAKLGFPEAAAAKLLVPVYGVIGFESWKLSNNNANIKRVKTRITELDANHDRADVEEAHEGFAYLEDTGENRVMFEFDGKPNNEVRTVLKSHGFKWSSSRMAWVRKMTGNALWAGEQVKAALQELEVE